MERWNNGIVGSGGVVGGVWGTGERDYGRQGVGELVGEVLGEDGLGLEEEVGVAEIWAGKSNVSGSQVGGEGVKELGEEAPPGGSKNFQVS